MFDVDSFSIFMPVWDDGAQHHPNIQQLILRDLKSPGLFERPLRTPRGKWRVAKVREPGYLGADPRCRLIR